MEINNLQELAEKQFFSVSQQEAGSYVEKFRGNGFYTLKKEDIMFVKGRETEYGATVFKLVPPRTMLYTKIAETFHRKYHLLGGSPVYIRTQILEVGYYMPQIVKRLKASQDRCAYLEKGTKKDYCHVNSWI